MGSPLGCRGLAVRMRREGAFSILRRCGCRPHLVACLVLTSPYLVSLSELHVPRQQNEDAGFAGSPSSFLQSLLLASEPLGRGTGAAGLSLSTDYSLLLTFIYDGHVVGEAQVQSLDCRLVAEPSVSQCGMEQVIFPKPGPREPTQRLLSQLKRGVLVASNSRGLFVQRLCPIPISWSAPQAPPGPGPHLLPSNECVELFRTAYFCRGEAAPAEPLSPFPHLCSPSTGPATTLCSLQHIPRHSPGTAPALVQCSALAAPFPSQGRGR